jgi:hypothetical protein
MAQADQQVQNAAFPAVRADINDNLAALFSQSSGASAPSVAVAFQPWIDTSSSPAVWKVRNATNTGWITVGTLDATTFAAGGVTPITSGGTGAITAAAALAALLPSQTGNSGKGLTTDGTTASWGVIAAGASLQVFTATGTYTPTAGKTTFLVFATGGGSGGIFSTSAAHPGAAGGTAVRLYSLTEMGSTASVSIGAGGVPAAAGGSTVFDPGGTGLTITGNGASTGSSSSPPTGGGSVNSQLSINGGNASRPTTANLSYVWGASSFWGSAIGGGGFGYVNTSGGSGGAGSSGAVFILEF